MLSYAAPFVSTSGVSSGTASCLTVNPEIIAPAAATMRLSRFGTVLFSDLKIFTAIGEKVSPERLIGFLNEYYAVLTPPIESNGGVITQIQKDTKLAVLNVIYDDPIYAASAVRDAREMHRAIDGATFQDDIKLSARSASTVET